MVGLTGEEWLRRCLERPGHARPPLVTAITATDSRGAFALEAPSGMVAEWHAPRDVEGDVHVRYTLALESIPMLQGGPPTAVRVDGRAFSGIGEVLFAQPNLETPVAIKVD